MKKQKEIEAVSDEQVCEKNPFGIRDVCYKCLNLLMVIASNGYWYCTCKFNFQKYPPNMVSKSCPVCTIQNNCSHKKLEEVKYSCVKLLIFYNKRFQ